MTLDKNLPWTHHVNKLIIKTKSSINLLRSLSAKKWGASKTAQLQIYKTLIKPKITYGMELFSSISGKNKSKLDSIQYKCLKIICTAPHATALSALQNKTGELPFHLEQNKLLLRHIVRLKNSPNNPTNSVTIDSWHNHYTKRHTPTTYQQIEEYLPQINKYNSIQGLSTTPPWQLKPIKTDIFLSSIINKTTTTPETAKMETLHTWNYIKTPPQSIQMAPNNQISTQEQESTSPSNT